MGYESLKQKIRDVPDFPKPGILFKDITPLLEDSQSFHDSIEAMSERIKNRSITKICAIESRGFIFGSALALRLGMGLVVIRKPKKLPWKTRSVEYDLEYGTDCLEMHVDSLSQGEVVAIVDDVLATGGTALAAARLVEGFGARVGACAFLSEIRFLKGREKLHNYLVESILEL